MYARPLHVQERTFSSLYPSFYIFSYPCVSTLSANTTRFSSATGRTKRGKTRHCQISIFLLYPSAEKREMRATCNNVRVESRTCSPLSFSLFRCYTLFLSQRLVLARRGGITSREDEREKIYFVSLSQCITHTNSYVTVSVCVYILHIISLRSFLKVEINVEGNLNNDIRHSYSFFFLHQSLKMQPRMNQLKKKWNLLNSSLSLFESKKEKKTLWKFEKSKKLQPPIIISINLFEYFSNFTLLPICTGDNDA